MSCQKRTAPFHRHNSQVAASTAPGLQAIGCTVAVEIVPLLDITALHQHRKPVKAEVGGGPEADALAELA